MIMNIYNKIINNSYSSCEIMQLFLEKMDYQFQIYDPKIHNEFLIIDCYTSYSKTPMPGKFKKIYQIYQEHILNQENRNFLEIRKLKELLLSNDHDTVKLAYDMLFFNTNIEKYIYHHLKIKIIRIIMLFYHLKIVNPKVIPVKKRLELIFGH